MFINPELQFLEEKVVKTTLNTTGAREHVPEVDIQIQVIKEQMRAQHASLPFTSFTRRMTIEISKNVVMFLNAPPPKSGM